MALKLTFAELRAIISDYINPAKIGSTDFTPSSDNIAQLVDKIGLMVTYDGSFTDKLSLLDGEELPLGKTIEEWYQDLIPARDYDPEGTNALKPAYPSYRKPTYSYTLGRKKWHTTIKYDEYERACNDMGELARIVAQVTKRLGDSEITFQYAAKKQGIGVLCEKCKESVNPSKTYAPSTAYEEGEFVKKDATPTAVGVIMKDLESSNTGDWDANVANGNIVPVDLVTEIAVPSDTATGEAFIKQVKKDVETASFIKEGHCLSGAVIGAEEGLVLLIRDGIMPTLEVETLAGAFHAEKLNLPADVVVVDDFGNETECFAVLADKRMLKLHNTYRATREQPNGDGDFLNLFRHSENTMHISRNTFVKVYKKAA